MKLFPFTSDYVDTLLHEVETVCANKELLPSHSNPPPLSSTFERPLKAEAVTKHRSRFGQ